MSDIVERLRAEVDHDVNEPLDRLLDEAADEIERLRTRLVPDRDGIARLIDGEAWIAIWDGRDALPDSMWHMRRDWALRKAGAILDLYAVTLQDGGGK